MAFESRPRPSRSYAAWPRSPIRKTACSSPAAPCEDCIEANVVVAAANGKLETRLCYLHIAVEEGERLWTPVIQTYGDVNLWDIEAARPWLHAIKALGDEFFEAGWYDDAKDAYGRLLSMDPGDHLGARDNLDRIGPRFVRTV